MADLKQYIDALGGQELVKQVKAWVGDNTVNAEALALALADYAKSTEVAEQIKTAVEASEKKIFGDGELAEAFDTIKEIGDYLENHDDVATALNEAIAKKLDKETYDSDKETFETKENAAATYQPKGDYVENSDLEEALQDVVKNDALEGTLEDYVKTEDLNGLIDAEVEALIEPVPTATIQGWFAD